MDPLPAALKVLLVDDDPIQGRLLAARLTHCAETRVELEVAPTLADALAAVAARSFDVVLLDLMLPDSREYDTFERMAAAAPGTPVLVMSGMEDEDLAWRLVRSGAQDFIDKAQSDPRLLERALRFAVARSRFAREGVAR
jgi:DNA-binding NtrC family response regulator